MMSSGRPTAPASPTLDIDYSLVHDSSLKRVLQRDELTDVRTRYFFNGLTEEVTMDNSFEFDVAIPRTS